jgi:hypothetical protein
LHRGILRCGPSLTREIPLSPVARVLVIALVRLILLFFAIWFAFREDALGEGASLVSRMGIVLLFLVVFILLGELDKLRTHFGLLVGALRAAGGAGGGAAAAAGAAAALGGDAVPEPDTRASVDILIRALGAPDADTRDKAHKHLVRLTGKNLPAEHALWERWWQENRDRFDAAGEKGA